MDRQYYHSHSQAPLPGRRRRPAAGAGTGAARPAAAGAGRRAAGPTAAEIRAEAAGRDQADRRHPRDLRRAATPRSRPRRSARAGTRPRLRAGGPAGRPAQGAGRARPRRATPSAARVLEAACMLTAKLDGVEKLFDEQTLEAASKRFRGGIGLQELLLEAAWANGYTGRNFRDSRARAAVRLRAGTGGRLLDRSTSAASSPTWPTSSCWRASSRVERTWRNICAVRNVSRLQDRHQLPADRQGPVRAGRPGRRAQARHAGQRDLHQQGRHLRPDARRSTAGTSSTTTWAPSPRCRASSAAARA